MMEQLKHMKESLICCAQSQMSHLDQVNAEELGEVVEMIKNIEEAIYYCTITEAMNGKGNSMNGNNHMMNSEDRMTYMEPNRMYYMEPNRMYYPNGNGNRSNSGNNNSNTNRGNETSSNSDMMARDRRGYQEYEYEYPMEMRDYREGRSPRSRRMYMEAQQSHADKTTQMRELEKYMQELSQDITEMIQSASSEERQYLEKKLNVLSSKIAQMN